MGPEMHSWPIQQSHATWSCSHTQKAAACSRDTLTLQRLLRKTENLQDCPSSKQFPSTAAGPDLTSCHSKNAELCKAPASASPSLQPKFLPSRATGARPAPEEPLSVHWFRARISMENSSSAPWWMEQRELVRSVWYGIIPPLKPGKHQGFTRVGNVKIVSNGLDQSGIMSNSRAWGQLQTTVGVGDLTGLFQPLWPHKCFVNSWEELPELLSLL